MSAITLRPPRQRWQTVSFTSTLFLHPILDLLLSDVPEDCESDLRLGLQEALVNAAKHGNNLDPCKTVLVQFARTQQQCWWVITDQGSGFVPPTHCCLPLPHQLIPAETCECGRGLYILYQVFDRVIWNGNGTELQLCKYLQHPFKQLLMHSHY